MDKNKLRGYALMKGLTLEGLSKKLGINSATLYRKMGGNSDFTLAEIQLIQNILSLSFNEIEDIFFTNYLTKTQDEKYIK